MRQSNSKNCAAAFTASVGLVLPPPALADMSLGSAPDAHRSQIKACEASPLPSIGTLAGFHHAMTEYGHEYQLVRDEVLIKEQSALNLSHHCAQLVAGHAASIGELNARTSTYEQEVTAGGSQLDNLASSLTALNHQTGDIATSLAVTWTQQSENVIAYTGFAVDVSLKEVLAQEERFKRDASRYYIQDRVDFEVARFRAVILSDVLFSPPSGVTDEIAKNYRDAGVRAREQLMAASYSPELSASMVAVTSNFRDSLVHAAVYKKDPSVLGVAKQVLEGAKTAKEFVDCIHTAAVMCFSARQAHVQQEINASMRILTAPTIEDALAINSDMDKRKKEMNEFCENELMACIDDAKREFETARKEAVDRYCDDYSSIKDHFDRGGLRDSGCDRMSSERCHDFSRDTCRDTSSGDTGDGGFSDDYSSAIE